MNEEAPEKNCTDKPSSTETSTDTIIGEESQEAVSFLSSFDGITKKVISISVFRNVSQCILLAYESLVSYLLYLYYFIPFAFFF
jgi:hypothetical protein